MVLVTSAISQYFHLPCKGVHIRPQLPLQEVNQNNDIWGPHFPSGTSILLNRSIFAINILLPTKNDKHKQRVFKSSQHKLMCIRLSRSWDEPRAKKTNLDMNKYINLSAIKGNQEFASYTLLHITCDLWYIFSPGPFSIPASLLNGPRWRNKMYLTLQKRKRKQGNQVMWHVMFNIADKDHRSSNTGWNPGSDPSSNLGSNPVSKFRYPRPVSRYILTTW